MSIQSEINRINSNVQSALHTLSAIVTVAEGAGSDQLPDAAQAVADEMDSIAAALDSILNGTA